MLMRKRPKDVAVGYWNSRDKQHMPPRGQWVEKCFAAHAGYQFKAQREGGQEDTKGDKPERMGLGAWGLGERFCA